jgi:hypothetical protein
MFKLNAFQLKCIAIVGMILNHAVFALEEIIPLWLMFPMYAAGGLTFAIMGYFVVEGFRHTSSLKRYMLRLLIFGIIATPFHFLVFQMPVLNTMFTILYSLLMLIMYEKLKSRVVFWILFIILSPLTFFLDLYVFAVFMVILYHAIKTESTRRTIPPIINGIVFTLIMALAVFGVLSFQSMGYPYGYAMLELFEASFGSVNIIYASVTFGLGSFLAAFLLKNYNGERGKPMKWAFYVIYPVHFIVLWGLSLLI